MIGDTTLRIHQSDECTAYATGRERLYIPSVSVLSNGTFILALFVIAIACFVLLSCWSA